MLVDYLGGCAKEEVLCHPDEVRRHFGALVSLLRRMFGPCETVTSLYAEFYSRMQSVGETLAEYSSALFRLHPHIEAVAPTVAKRNALRVLGDGALKHQFVVGVRDEWVRHELRRLMSRSADRPFIAVRGKALCLMCEEEARVVQMRPVEKAAPALSDPVGGSVSCVLGLDAVVSGDDGVSTGAVGRYVSVGDVSVSCGSDMDLYGVDTVLSGAVSGGRCDLDSVSRGDLVVRVGEMSLSGGLDAVVSGVDKSVCCNNSVLANGILDLVSGVDDSVCGVSSVMTAGDLEVCGCDSLVSDGVGDPSGVEVVDDVVACDDDTTLLPDAFRDGGWLSVVGLGVVQPGWVAGLICADDSLRPEPPPIHAMCLCRSLLAAV